MRRNFGFEQRDLPEMSAHCPDDDDDDLRATRGCILGAVIGGFMWAAGSIAILFLCGILAP